MDSETERRVVAAIERLEQQEDITTADLERFRQSLPTDELQGKFVELALPFPWSEVFEFVEGSERQSAYWRVKPDRSEPRSEADRRHRERFAEAARETEGMRGTVTGADGEIPKSASAIAEKVRGSSNGGSSESGVGGRAMTRLLQVLD